MTEAEKLQAWNDLAQSGRTLDAVILAFAAQVEDATRAAMRTGPFVPPKEAVSLLRGEADYATRRYTSTVDLAGDLLDLLEAR